MVVSVKTPPLLTGFFCVCEVELDLEGSVLSCSGDMSTGGCINNDGDAECWDVGESPTEHGAGTSAIEGLELLVGESWSRNVSVHWSWFGCV